MAMLHPLGDQIVIRPRVKKHEGLIQVASVEVTQEGDVLAVGPGFVCEDNGHMVPMSVQVGDIIMYSPSSGQAVKVGDEFLTIICERNIFGILKE